MSATIIINRELQTAKAMRWLGIVRHPCNEGVIRAGKAPAPAGKGSARWILAATILGSSMAFIDGTVVNVALPALQDKLNATAADLQWVVESYALFLSALLLVGGSLGDHYGRRRIFIIGVLLFACSSVWCGLASDIDQLIIARAAQGIGGALLIPGSLAIISASFSEERRGQAIGTWSGFTAITTAFGPVLGGWLIEHVSWRAVFFLNAPLAIAIVVIAVWHVPESRDSDDSKGLDWTGAALATASLGAIVYGLIDSSRLGFGHWAILSGLFGGSALFAAFMLIEARKRNALLPLALFRSKTFSGANLLTLLLYTALSGALFFLPLNLIQVQGYTATAAGGGLLPFVLIMFSLSRWSGGLVKRFGPRLPLIIGPIVAALGFGLFTLPGVGGSYWKTFFPAIVVLGLGMAISVAPLTTTVMGSVGHGSAGVASGINNAVSRTAGLLAIAALSIVMSYAFNSKLEERLNSLNVSPEVRGLLEGQRAKLAGAEMPDNLNSDMREGLKRAFADSFVAGFRWVMIISFIFAVSSALVAWLMIEVKIRSIER